MSTKLFRHDDHVMFFRLEMGSYTTTPKISETVKIDRQFDVQYYYSTNLTKFPYVLYL